MTINRWESKGWLPRRVHLGPNVVAWSYAEVEDFAKQLMAQRQNSAVSVREDGAGSGK